MLNRIFRVGVIVPLLVTSLTVAGAASAASASHRAPGPTPSKEKSANVVSKDFAGDVAPPIDEAGGAAQSWVDEHGWSGFGHIGLDLKNDAVDVFGTTTPPRGLLADLQEQYPSIRFVYVKSAFTSAELLAAAAAISQKFLSGPYALTMVGADAGDNGLVVAPVDQSLLAPAKARRLVAAIGSVYPVKVVAGYGVGHLTVAHG